MLHAKLGNEKADKASIDRWTKQNLSPLFVRSSSGKTAVGSCAAPNDENKNVLSPGRGVPIAPMVRRKTAEHEVGTRLKRNVVALLGRQREIFKMGLAVVARIYPYDHARAPSHGEIIVHAKAYSAASPTTKPLASLLRTLPPDKSVANGISSKVTASSSACKQSIRRGRTTISFMLSTHIYDGRSHGT